MCDTSNALVRSLVIWYHTVLPATHRWFSCLYPTCCRHSFINPGRMKGWVDLGGWLYQMVYPEKVTHPSINRARRRVTTLIETNALPLSQASLIAAQVQRRTTASGMVSNCHDTRSVWQSFSSTFHSHGSFISRMLSSPWSEASGSYSSTWWHLNTVSQPYIALPQVVTSPQTWSDLPEDVTSAESSTTFRHLLKTHLFRKSFPDYMLDINWLSPVDQAVVPLLRSPRNWLIGWRLASRQNDCWITARTTGRYQDLATTGFDMRNIVDNMVDTEINASSDKPCITPH